MSHARNSLQGTVTIPKSVTTSDYNSLMNLPKINGKTIKGDLTLDDLGIDLVSEEEVKKMVQEAIKDLPAGEGGTYTISLNSKTGLYELKDGEGNVTSTFKVPKKVGDLEDGEEYITVDEVQDIMNEHIVAVDDTDVEEMLDEVMPEDEPAAE